MEYPQKLPLICVFLLFISPIIIYSQISFQRHIINEQTDGTGGIIVCDIDNDNDQDVLAASLQDNQIVLFENIGGNPIEWNKNIIGANVVGAHSVQAADFDSDDDLDVVGAAYQGTPGVAMWRNDGGNPISWTKQTVGLTFRNAHEVHVHDLDKDGDMDVLGASSDLNKISWWNNNGGNPIQWIEQTIVTGFTLAKSVHAGDIDGDGYEDVIGASIVDNDVTWWKNDGNDPINWTKYTIDGNFIGAHRI